MKKILLISNRVMHYRISVYNYFASNFVKSGWQFIVRSNEIQKQNPHTINFDFKEIDFKFSKYKEEILRIKPDAVIIFLHLKDKIIWPLVHWLIIKRIPIIFWTKGLNLDAPDNKLSHLLYQYMHEIFNRIILYSRNEIKYIRPGNRKKVSVANNTINFDDFPDINESKVQIKQELNIPFKKIVLFVGRMGADGGRKKVHHLIEIFNSIDNSEMGLVLVGSGMSDELTRKINKENTIYLGEVHDPEHIQISKVFKMSDICAIPGHVGLGLNQAFYWGLPVITEEGLQPPEIHYLIDGRNGYIVPNNDLEALKNRILFLLQNDEIRSAFSQNARSDILQHASIEQMFLGFKNCIDSMI